MNLEDIVCSLELAKKLKDLGIKQESLFHWVEVEHETSIYRTVWEAKELNNTIACAFTASELSEILPELFTIKCNLTNEYICYWTIEDIKYPFSDKLLVNSCAKMLIYLIENELIKND